MPTDTKTVDNYSNWKRFHAIKTKDSVAKGEFEGIEMVRKDYEAARLGRRNSCWWTTKTSGSGDLTDGTGGDWVDHWDKQKKAWLMWYQPSENDDFLSNIKSPTTTGRIESTFHKFRKLNIRWEAIPNSESDMGKEEVFNFLFEYWA
ncbi:MAG: hypothetical protein HC908_11810, partial [Calothrix sp. SM1_7_51]|nr:hypothetical protein [Calothrix sp. SM1_7_51]